MAEAQVVKSAAGEWWVDGGNVQVGPFETNAAAWRHADKLNGDVRNRQEATADWLSKQYP